jgi:sugar lactone lactonase YvrE
MHHVSRLLALLVALGTLCLPTHAAAGGPPTSSAQYVWRTYFTTHSTPLFYQGAGVAAGSTAGLFIADAGDHRIKKFSSAGRLLSSWGTDTPGGLFLSGPRAIAVDGQGNVYVADNGLLKLSPAGKLQARWTGGALTYPRGLAADRNGNIYVLSLHPAPSTSLFDRVTITRLSPSGRVLGSFVYTYSDPIMDAVAAVAIATTPGGNLLMSIRGQHGCPHSCDGTYYLLRAVSPAGKTLWEVPEDAGGQSITTDASGNMYIAAGASIEKLSPTGTKLRTFGAAGCAVGAFGTDLQVAASRSGQLFVADTQGAAIRPDNIPAALTHGVVHVLGLDGSPVALYGSCPAPGAGTAFGQINDVAVSRKATISVADGILSKVFQLSGGRITGEFDAVHPSTVSVDVPGNVYVPNLQQTALEKHAPSGGLLARTTGWPIEASAVASSGIVYALYVFGEVLVFPPVGHGNKPIRRWTLNGYTHDEGGLVPQGICLDGQGNVWVADTRHNNIQKYSPSGRLLLIFGRQGSGPRRFRNPTALTVDGRGHLWVADSNNNRVQEFDLSGRYIASYGREGQGLGQFLQLEGVGADARGNVYVGDRGNDRIQELVMVRAAGTTRTA